MSDANVLIALDPELEEDGTWKRMGKSALVRCPNPRKTMVHHGSLYDHEIADTGDVTPSVACEVAGCGFHEYITLEDWDAVIPYG